MFYKLVKLSLLFICCIYLFPNCDKNPTKSKSFTPLSGDWTGSDISFSIGGNPLSVSNISFSYSGYASGAYCSFTYNSTTTLSTSIKIEDNTFSYDSGSYTIKGTFGDKSHVTIKISWSLYDSYCMASYSGTKTYYATYSSGFMVMKVKPNVESQENEEIIEIIDNDSKTTIRKQYKMKN